MHHFGKRGAEAAERTVVGGDLLDRKPTEIAERKAVINPVLDLVVAQPVPSLKQAHPEQKLPIVARAARSTLALVVMLVDDIRNRFPIQYLIDLREECRLYFS